MLRKEPSPDPSLRSATLSRQGRGEEKRASPQILSTWPRVISISMTRSASASACSPTVGRCSSGVLGRLVGRVDAGEVLDLRRRAPWRRGPSGRAAMQTSSGVSTKTSTNSPSPTQVAHHPPLGAERRDEGAQHDQAGVDEQLRDLADAADVLDAVGVGEAEVAVEAVAHVVAVEHVGVVARAVQLALDEVGDGRLARAGQAGEPQDRRLLALERGARLPCRSQTAWRWMLVARRRPKLDHAGRRPSRW